jgi:hypothetical protein
MPRDLPRHKDHYLSPVCEGIFLHMRRSLHAAHSGEARFYKKENDHENDPRIRADGPVCPQWHCHRRKCVRRRRVRCKNGPGASSIPQLTNAGMGLRYRRSRFTKLREIIMRTILSVLVTLSVLAGTALAPASAQSSRAPQQRPTAVTIDPYDRGPPLPPDRVYPSPRSEIAPPMERVPPIAPLAPRIGD